jgi:subtilase family serine protease
MMPFYTGHDTGVAAAYQDWSIDMARPLPPGHGKSTRLRPFILVCAALLPVTAFAVQKPRPEDRVLPNFDSRQRGPRTAGVSAEVEQALRELRSQGTLTLQSRFHPRTRALRLLSAREGSLTPPSGDDPEAIARRFLRAHRGLFGLAESDLPNLVRTRALESRGGKIRHVLFEQVLDGIPVFGGIVGVHLDEAGRVVFVSNNLAADSDAAGARRATPRLPAEDAIRAGLANIRPELQIEPSLLSPARGRERRATYARGPLKRDIQAQLVYFPAQPRPRLAWRLLLEPAGFPQSYDVLVDAESGDVLYRHNRVYYADGVGSVVQSAATAAQDPRLLDEHPTGSGSAGELDPSTGCPPLLGYSSRDLTAPFRDQATVLSNTGRLTGNNTRAYRGFVGTLGALGTADSDGRWHFEYPFGAAASAETQLFFAANFLHDFFYDLGFDEAAGNFQANNFGRGGSGGDPVNVVARADGRNNATWEPQPDGVSPTMSMFLFDGSGCWSADVDGDGLEDLDGDYDLDIIIHEYHHGVSTRLNTDWTGDEADAMGEGGSDFFAYSITGNTKLAEYVAPPDGIRQVNTKTYADWFCFDFFGYFFFCEPHDNGEIWANTLWDMREQFRTDLVKGSEAAAINEVHQLYIDGLKLSPASPTMLDMRDAMLQADQNRNPSTGLGGSENYCRMWLAFSGRGMGTGALDTQDTGDGTVVADLSVPAGCPGRPVVTVAATDPNAAEVGLETASFTFSRTGSTDADLVVSYAVGGTAAPGTDYVPLSGTLTIPAGAAEASVVLTPVDDPLVEPAESVEVEVLPSFAYLIGTQSIASASIVSEDVAPDLRATLTVPLLAAAGGPLGITETTSNPGTDASAASVTRYYLSVDAALDPSDVVLGSRPVPALAIGANSTASTTVTLPPGTPAGSYFVLAEADADHAIEEISETNNLGLAPVRIGPDLAITVLAPVVAGAGAAISLSDTTHNFGGGPAAASVTKFYLSSDTLLDATDALLGSRAAPALAAGTGSAGSTTGTIPAGTAAGVYFLIAQADGDGAVLETFETNNLSFTSASVGPDLVITPLVVTPTGGAGAVLSVTDTTRNQGGGGAGASTTRFYLSANGLLDASDTPLGGRAVPALAGATNSSGSTLLTIPAGTSAGTYYVLAVADGDGAVAEYSETNNVGLAWIQIGPDLVMTALTAPATAGIGASISVSDTTKNQGGGTAGASTTRFYLSTNGIVDASDALLGVRDVGALAAGASSSGTTTLTIPAGTAAGAYYVLAQADGAGVVGETAETNNTTYAFVQVGPDLTITALTGPASSGAGSSITVNDTTRNQSSGAAPASTTRFYLSANGLLDASDTPLGGRAVPALAGATNSSGSTLLTIPAGTAAGGYYLLAQADGDLAIPETVESNNTTYFFLWIGPDLTMSALTAPATAGAGASVSVADTTRNIGGAAAQASMTNLYLSANAALDASDTLLGARSVPALAAGASSSGTSSVTIPAGTPAGTWFILAQADGGGAVGETIETNNTSYAFVQVGPDLTIAALTGPATSGAGSSITLNDTTRNQGAGAAPASTTRFYLSTNALVDASDTLLGGRDVGALVAGASSSGTTSLTIPAGTATGGYYVLGQADGGGVVGESSETNNVALVFVQVGPDLAIAALAAPATAGVGGTIAVSDTTRNQGGGSAEATTTKFYLSTNGAVDAGDTLLGGRDVALLLPGGSSSGTTTLTIPAGIASGGYYIVAQADGAGVVGETVETNNTHYAFVQVGPDLIVPALTAPASGGAGSSIIVSDTTRNQGGGGAPASTTRFYLSTNGIVDAGDALLGSREVEALAGGATSSGSTSLTIPVGTNAGPYYVLAQADGGGVVAEASEANNVAWAFLQIGPDLAITAVTAPSGAGAGTSISVADTTRNQGSGSAAPSTTRFYLSKNGAVDAGDTLLGGRDVEALAPGATSSGTTSLTIPAATVPGAYYVVAQADGAGVVGETVETNNTHYVFVQVGPDLAVSALTGPAAGAAGTSINLDDTSRNQGGGAAPGTTTRFYLSSNGVVDAGDALLGSRAVPALGAGASSSGTTSLTIPAGTAPGYYYILAVADGDNALAESIETNNMLSRALSVTP